MPNRRGTRWQESAVSKAVGAEGTALAGKNLATACRKYTLKK